MNKSVKVAGVVVLYNPSDDDIKNINSYIDDIDILYVMDNSNNDNKKRLPKNKKINYIYNGDNLGMATPLNKAAKLARKEKIDWLLTMDQDTNFNFGVIKEIKKRLSTIDYKKIGIVTPWHNTKLRIKKSNKTIDYPLDVMTSGNFLNLEIHKKMGGFKDWIFVDGVDMEYCLNLHKNNYQIIRYNDLEIIHNLGEIEYKKFLWKELLITNHTAMRRYYQVRNYHYINDLYNSDFPDYCKRLIKLKAIIIGIIFFEKDKFNKLRACYRGYRDYKAGLRGKSYERYN